jgi:hypothetical protein
MLAESLVQPTSNRRKLGRCGQDGNSAVLRKILAVNLNVSFGLGFRLPPEQIQQFPRLRKAVGGEDCRRWLLISPASLQQRAIKSTSNQGADISP